MHWKVLSLFIVITFLQTDSWRLDKDKNGIKVYTRKVENYSIREFKVAASSPAQLSAFDQIMRDINNYKDWMPDITESKILATPEENIYIYHTVINSPFPVSDRDLVTKTVFSYPDPNTLLISLEAVDDYLPVNDDYVRIKSLQGFWKFSKEGDQTTINNQFLSDPGGSIPTWVVNSFLASNPYNTIKSLKEEVE